MLEQHENEEHKKKKQDVYFVFFLAAGRFQLNEHTADVHPLPRRVQNFGNYVIEDGRVVFSDEEEDDDYDVSKEEEDSEEEEEEDEEDDEETVQGRRGQ